MTLEKVEVGLLGSTTEVSPKLWPGIVILVGTVLVVVGLMYSFPSQRVSQAGEIYERLSSLVRRVATARHEHAGVFVAAREGRTSMRVPRSGTEWEFGLTIDPQAEATIAEIKSYFALQRTGPTDFHNSGDKNDGTLVTHVGFQALLQRWLRSQLTYSGISWVLEMTSQSKFRGYRENRPSKGPICWCIIHRPRRNRKTMQQSDNAIKCIQCALAPSKKQGFF